MSRDRATLRAIDDAILAAIAHREVTVPEIRALVGEPVARDVQARLYRMEKRGLVEREVVQYDHTIGLADGRDITVGATKLIWRRPPDLLIDAADDIGRIEHLDWDVPADLA